MPTTIIPVESTEQHALYYHSLNRIVTPDSQIALRVQFTDAEGLQYKASNVSVYIFDPNGDTNDNNTAVASSTSPTYLGQGVFEYVYTMPSNASKGTWWDKWVGTVDGVALTSVGSFQNVVQGSVGSFAQQIGNNMVFEVTIDSSTLQSTSAATMSEDYTFTFSSKLTPLFTTLRKVRLEGGSALNNINDWTIWLAIREASLETKYLSFSDDKDSDFYKFARTKWTTCRALYMLLSDAIAAPVKFKKLGDFSVAYDTSATGLSAERLNDLRDCMARWEDALRAGATDFTPRPVVKGENDVDRMDHGSLYISPRNAGDPEGFGRAGANSKVTFKSGGRRKRWTWRRG